TATATSTVRNRNGTLSTIDRLNSRLSTNRSKLNNKAGNTRTESLPNNDNRNKNSETRYQAIELRCLYFRYARKPGSTNAAATKSFRLEIHAMVSTWTGSATNKACAEMVVARCYGSANATRYTKPATTPAQRLLDR